MKGKIRLCEFLRHRQILVDPRTKWIRLAVARRAEMLEWGVLPPPLAPKWGAQAQAMD